MAIHWLFVHTQADAPDIVRYSISSCVTRNLYRFLGKMEKITHSHTHRQTHRRYIGARVAMLVKTRFPSLLKIYIYIPYIYRMNGSFHSS